MQDVESPQGDSVIQQPLKLNRSHSADDIFSHQSQGNFGVALGVLRFVIDEARTRNQKKYTEASLNSQLISLLIFFRTHANVHFGIHMCVSQ